ncbi:DUF2827 domain-containing protein [Dyella japonica]|uniref:DUF2827 domain-containing protein n=1 Tax=Dyella japonica A8 TaxID=1217721 RepID=A0A075K613_9GAMM|nr:DUF2827 domain-containing protein [Dyella japonica]AIF47613.1 hypothetical protein HY57_10220 [Dyella japonica A8]
MSDSGMRRRQADRLRVGVTLHLRENAQSIWENGIFQNCLFLVQLLQRSPVIERAVLVIAGDGKTPHPSMMMDEIGVEMIDVHAAFRELDVVIEMSAQLGDDWVKAFREDGGRYVWMKVGNDYVIDIERAMFDKPHAGLASDKPYDAVWTIPEYEHSCRDYFSMMARAPLSIVPHLWTPYFFDRAVARLPPQHSWGYQPGKQRWRVCVFEPNVCMVKTSVIPMLACEEAYRAQPGMLENLRVCNTLHLKEHEKFLHFARSLDVVNHGLASFEGRFPTADFMAQFGDCVISHHWENGQNYLYYEVLYGGYPLIHNSTFIKQWGYYYSEFDCAEGGRALLEAFRRHDSELDAYRHNVRGLLAALDTANPENVMAYTRELQRLY